MTARIKQSGFTLLEACIALSLIAICFSLSFATITKNNQIATTARLFTLAQELARNKIDQIESAAPFNPLNVNSQGVLTPLVPTVLTMGTSTDSNVTLYADPSTSPATVVVKATVTTVISDAGSYNARAGQVTVSFTYRGKSFSVPMNTIRVPDT
jgi:type II secretory pathway pseudopilin PulG